MQNNTSVSIATYNILHPFFAVEWSETAGLSEEGLKASKEDLQNSIQSYQNNVWKIYSNWDQRSGAIASNIKLADIVCLQEIAEDTLKTLQELTNYQLASSVYHYYPGETKFGNAIVYNEERVSLKETSQISYETPPDIRSAASAVLEVSTKTIKVVSVHLSGYYPKEPDHQKKQMAKVKGFNELQSFKTQVETEVEGLDGIVIAGDFNESKDEEEAELYRPGYLIEAGYRHDNCFIVTEPLKNRKIDWLFYKSLTNNAPTLTSMDLEKLQTQASDHLMSGTFLEWKA